ncbi:DUF1622 domain-containing protein [Lacinutrix sp. 5H-3-7-4]|uniref:DUF1622 domain-containing protein n=1 Tax=Lacinutrix sp. (strain 5H-3-7-4) TaxID=983544 RepID=UPI00020A3345|nr:DUF1622 domain-containing protein [Lacinutrix sp. 5H-3-7-4]AEH02397.1 protein of unknown function DUF1622 [Lacinutrix sp. 5H-3-7-4]
MKHYIEIIARIIEAIGIAIILIGLIYSLINYTISSLKKRAHCYIELRKNLGKFILLGLEILIAADIVATVITEPTLKSTLILGLIVLIRTVLSLSIQVEIEGKFPWQNKSSNQLQK